MVLAVCVFKGVPEVGKSEKMTKGQLFYKKVFIRLFFYKKIFIRLFYKKIFIRIFIINFILFI